ncbi:MAG: hypothetical protein WC795_02785 [Candidatus Paceibacterota bacterium]|jgi:hypothetical protein
MEKGLDALKDLKWLIGILVILWFVWFFTGGPKRFEQNNKPFIKPPSPINSGERYGPDGKLQVDTKYIKVQQTN